MRRGRKKKIRTGFAGFLAGLVFVVAGTGFRLQAAAAVMESNDSVDAAVTGPAAEEENVSIPELSLNSQSAVLMDVKTGRIVYGKEADTIRPMASTTKIMTCILALEQGNPEELVEVSSYAASMPDVQLNIRAGEKYKLKDLLYSLMLESHNDSAVAVAEHIGGSVEKFAALMNQKARDIGCSSTYFITPNGVDGTDAETGKVHSTTAADLARIMRYCVSQSPKRDEFLSITRTASRTITDESQNRSFYLGNHNALLTMMPEVLSGKTGFTSGAGYCYVAALEKEEKEFTVALLGCGWPPHKTYKWEDMRKLSGYAFDQFDWYEVFEKGKQFPDAEVLEGKTEKVSLTMGLKEEEQTLMLLLRKGEEPEIRYEYPARLTAPVEAGTPVGKVTYSLDGMTVSEYPVYTGEAAERIDYPWCLKKCLDQFLH